MSRLRIKPYFLRLYLAVFILFVVNKFAVRPFVLERDSPVLVQMVVLSIPNTFEAIFGVGNVAGLLVLARHLVRPRLNEVPDLALYLLATALAGAYVVTQEFKLHDLGGRNAYDPYDVAASVIGIVGMFLVVWRFGIAERVGPLESE